MTGGDGSDTYIISTGLVGVDALQAETAPYNQSNSETVNVTITDAKAGDSYYLRDYGINDINMSTTSDGVVISSASGRINITLKNCDRNAVKNNLITFDTACGHFRFGQSTEHFGGLRRQSDYVVDKRELHEQSGRDD